MAPKTCLRLILLLAVALALRVAITHRSVSLVAGYSVDKLPTQLASHPGVDLPLTRFEVELLAPDGGHIVQRSYGSGERILWLAAVGSRNNWRVQHPPQICYTAQGWRIEEQSTRILRDTHARAYDVQHMIVSRDGVRRIVYYFYTDGNHWTSSYILRVLYAFLDQAISAKSVTWSLIQISTPLSSTDAEARVSAACLELFDRAVGNAER